MRWIILVFLLGFFSVEAYTQRAFPVKVNKKWGLMNSDGQLIRQPIYDGISEFKKYGYAVMQREGKVGVLDYLGTEIVPPLYEDTKILDSTLVAVMDQSEWMVLDINGNTILEKGYESVHIWEGRFLGFMKGRKWGLSDTKGRKICSPKYDEIELLEDDFFKTRIGIHYGLIDINGSVILEPLCDEISIHSDSLFFFKIEKNWGAVNQLGKEVISTNYDKYRNVSDYFISVFRKQKPFLYSIPAETLITEGEYEAYYPFSGMFALCKKERQLGLLDWKGKVVLPVVYDEITAFSETAFRAKKEPFWGIVALGNAVLLPFEYDYIAPPKDGVFLVKKNGRYGLMNERFETIAPPEFDRIEIGNLEAKAFTGEGVTIFNFDKNGNLKDENSFEDHFTISIGGQKKTARSRRSLNGVDNNDYLLDNFEWFYSSRQDRWGLRRLDDGSEQIPPTFDWVGVEKELGMTIVGIEKFTYFDFERTSYRFEMVYGIVNNDVGLLVTEINLWDVRLSDFFSKESRVARCIFEDGRHGLVSRNPVGLMPIKGYAFIGEFNDGLARVSKKGRISGTIKRKELPKGLGNLNTFLDDMMAVNSMVDYTLYDQEFQEDAQITCEECTWGYVDTTGAVIVEPAYTYARDFESEVGMVESGEKWGVIGTTGGNLVPCEYDGVHFLENTGNQIIRIYNNNPKYGLIDTLGQVTVNLQYDGLGAFREGRLAVERNGKWGFVNQDGREVIPCRFRKVHDFHEGLASVKTTRKWGFIDQNGDTAIEFKFRRLGDFKNGLAWAYTYKGVGYINKNGDFAIPPTYNKAHNFEGDIARVMVNGKYGLINPKGEYVVKPKYSDIAPFDENGLAIVRYGNQRVRYGVIDRSGSLITKQHFRSVQPYKEGRAAVKYKDGYGFIDLKGALVIEDSYSRVSDFSSGRAAVQRNGICGYIDLLGNEVVHLEYSKCLDFDEGKAVVYRGYRQGGIIDTLGNYIIEPSINRLLDFSDGRGLVRDKQARFYYITEGADMSQGYYQRAGKFNYGVAVVQSNSRWGIINQRGIEVIPPKYDKIESFINGYAKVRIKRFNGLTNLKGDLIIQPEYEYISYVGEGLFRVEQGDKIGYFDASGDWIWDLKE